ncbi:hypothetical protein ACFSYD_01845 [Paracoccus aerius]
MILSRRTSLILGLAASAATIMPRLSLAQTQTPTSFSFPVEGARSSFTRSITPRWWSRRRAA